MKVVIKSLGEVNDYGEGYESTEVYVDGELVGSGSYGGEPEDNFRFRDYAWVESLLTALARKLGADVVVEEGE